MWRAASKVTGSSASQFHDIAHGCDNNFCLEISMSAISPKESAAGAVTEGEDEGRVWRNLWSRKAAFAVDHQGPLEAAPILLRGRHPAICAMRVFINWIGSWFHSALRHTRHAPRCIV